MISLDELSHHWECWRRAIWAGLGVSMGHRLSFPRDVCGMAGLGRLPRAAQRSKIKIRLVWDCS